MFRLKANKTSLYKLVHNYEPLPKMRRTTFTKAPRIPDYWMEWLDACGMRYEAFLSVCVGKPMLSITKYDGGEDVSRVVHGLDIKDLLERGMVEEFTTATERGQTRGAVQILRPGNRLAHQPGG